MLLKNMARHFKTVMVHKYWVFYYCCMAGIPLRGIKHDMSKFSPTEFMESAKYYNGKISPIDVCKKENGYSKAWLHHKGRNTHHYEYWQDNFDKFKKDPKAGTALIMPFYDTVEMICDYLGAGRAYNGKKFTYKGEYEWWVIKNTTQGPVAMHPVTKEFVDRIMRAIAHHDIYLVLHQDAMRELYDEILEKYKRGEL